MPEVKTTSKDTFDVTPKEYAEWSGFNEGTVRRMFGTWFDQGRQFIMRIGVSTEKYPDGKNLFMSRAHFNSLQNRSEVAASEQPIRRN